MWDQLTITACLRWTCQWHSGHMQRSEVSLGCPIPAIVAVACHPLTDSGSATRQSTVADGSGSTCLPASHDPLHSGALHPDTFRLQLSVQSKQHGLLCQAILWLSTITGLQAGLKEIANAAGQDRKHENTLPIDLSKWSKPPAQDQNNQNNKRIQWALNMKPAILATSCTPIHSESATGKLLHFAGFWCSRCQIWTWKR